MLDIFSELKELLSGLDSKGIDYALCGGLAMAVYAFPRATLDIDLLIPFDAWEKIKAFAGSKGFLLEGKEMRFAGEAVRIRRLTKLDNGSEDFLTLDLILVSPELEKIWNDRERVPWEAGTISVVSRQGLIAMKRLRGSGQDEDDILNLEGGE